MGTSSNNETITYSYNAEGKRISKSDGTNTTKFVYEGTKIILEVDGNNNQLARNIYGNALVSRETNDIVGYYLYNGHGDVVAIIDEDEEVLNTYQYDAFGNILEANEQMNNPFRYAGYYYDVETGNYYLLSRYYNPEIARFISEDTYRGELNDPLSLNRYVYVNNNPLIYYDPTGYFWKEIGDFFNGIGNWFTGLFSSKEKTEVQETVEVVIDSISTVQDAVDGGNPLYPSPSDIVKGAIEIAIEKKAMENDLIIHAQNTINYNVDPDYIPIPLKTPVTTKNTMSYEQQLEVGYGNMKISSYYEAPNVNLDNRRWEEFSREEQREIVDTMFLWDRQADGILRSHYGYNMTESAFDAIYGGLK